jgi:hypothetical protein
VNNNDLRSFDFPAPNSADVGEYKSHTVFWLGEGPGVVLMHELPGLTDYVANFGREIATRGSPFSCQSCLASRSPVG